MKLIIDIPADIYDSAKNDYLCGSPIIVEAIKNGIPYEDKKVSYICDGTACDPEKASCKRGGPCHHTTRIEYAQHFFKYEDSDVWFEVDKNIGGENEND